MLSAIIENAREAVVSVDTDGKIIYANKAAEDLFGWKADELMEKPMSILAVDANEQKKQFMEALRKGGARFETVRREKDGSIIPVMMTVVPFKDEKGNLIFSSAIMVDMREQKKYESKIEHLNEVLRAIRNVNQLITKEKNKEKLLQKACDILVDVKGYTSVCISYKGKNYTAGEKKECKKALDFIKEKGTEKKEIASYRFNKRYLTVSPIIRNGIRASLYIIHSREFDGEELVLLKEISGDIAFALDAIDKERKLKEKEILLSHVFGSVQDGISILDTDLTIKYVNSAMEKWYEKNMPLVGKKCYEAYHNRKKPCDPCPSLRCMKSGKMEREIISDPFKQYIELFSYPIKDDSGNVTGVVEFVRDITERKKAEEKLKESEARFRSIFENATVGMYRTTPDGKILMANPFLVKLLDYESEEELKRRDLSKDEYYEPGYEREKFIKEIEEKGYFVGEQAWTRKDGSTIFVRESAVALRDEDGKTLYYDGVVEDITELKKTQDELIKSRDDWKAIFKSISDPVVVLAEDHTILDANPATLKALGKKREEVIGKKCFEFFHEGDEAAEGCPMKKLLRSRHPQTESMEMEALGGIFLVTVSPVFEGKEVTKVIHHAKDVTQLKQLIKALQESEDKYRSLFENSINAVAIHEVVTDEKGKPIDYVFLEVNDAFERETGLKAKDVVGKRVTEVLPEVDRKSIEEYGKISLKGGAARFETYSAPLGRYLDVSVFSLGKGRFVTIFRDISERVRHIEDLTFLADSMAKLNEISSSEELYTFVAEGIKKLSGDSIIVISSHDPSSRTQRVEIIEGIGKHASSLLKLLGKDPVGMEFKISDKYSAMRGKLIQMEEGISDLTQGKIPKGAASAIKKLLGIGDIYSIDIVRGKELFGNITILMKKGKKLENTMLIETFIKQAGVVNQRIIIRKALEESEEKYRAIVENSHDGIFIYRGDRFLYVNRRAEEISGYTKEELTGMNIWQLLHPDDREWVEDIGRRRARGEEVPTTYQARVVNKEGEVRICEFAVTPITYQGEYAALGSVRDITPQKLAEEKLSHSEREKTLILDTSPTLIAYQDTDHRVIWANRTAAESVGKRAEDLEGRKCFEIWHQRGEPCEGCPVARAVETGEMQEGEISTPDGRHWLVRGNPVVDEDGKVIGAVETTLDITERKRAEKALRESERKMKTLMDNLPGMAYRCRNVPTWTMEFVSDGCRELTGYEPEEVMNDTVIAYADIIHPEDREMVWKKVQKAVKKGEHFTLEYRILTKDKEERWVRERGVRVSSDEDEPHILEGFISDITERKEAEKERERAYQAVEQALEKERVFKMKTAHYFFNPIAISKGYMELALEELPDEQKKKIQQAYDAVMRIQKVVENIVQRGEIHE